MKIDSLNTPFINKEAQTEGAGRKREQPAGAPPESPRAEETAKGDVVQLSDRSRLIARAQELASGAPEVREAKVNELRSRIESGTYTVSGQVVAESMLRKSITEV